MVHTYQQIHLMPEEGGWNDIRDRLAWYLLLDLLCCPEHELYICPQRLQNDSQCDHESYIFDWITRV